MLRKIKPEDFEGKSIKKINVDFIDRIDFVFSDETKLSIVTDRNCFSSVGAIAGMFVEELDKEGTKYAL